MIMRALELRWRQGLGRPPRQHPLERTGQSSAPATLRHGFPRRDDGLPLHTASGPLLGLLRNPNDAGLVRRHHARSNEERLSLVLPLL